MKRPASLYFRVSLVMSGLTAGLLAILAVAWLHGTRIGISEEIQAASRVSVQLLQSLTEQRILQSAGDLMAVVRPLGRIRANELEIQAPDGNVLYRSPPPTYKAGRNAPAWFISMLDPGLPDYVLPLGQYRLVLRPDASRAIVDAWDELIAMTGWGLTLIVVLIVAIRAALARALRPLEQVMAALDRTGNGCFDTRLPEFSTTELSRLSLAFNGMADRLRSAVDDNVRLETEREVAQRLQERLEQERQDISRELHDELSQGITAVRALAGAIVQRSGELPAVNSQAQNIIAVMGTIQDGVRTILHRLRSPVSADLRERLDLCVRNWQAQHEEIALDATLDTGDAELSDAAALSVQRIVQEGLTNVARHSGATQAELRLKCGDGRLVIDLVDNGRGLPGAGSAQPGAGLGLVGMRERIALLGGELNFSTPPQGGFGLHVRLPVIMKESV